MVMGRLRIGHLVEAAFWLGLCLVLYVYSFEFDKDIEIYKFGATAWPRAIILLIAIAAIGQLVHHWFKGDEASSKMISAAVDDGAEEAAGRVGTDRALVAALELAASQVESPCPQ